MLLYIGNWDLYQRLDDGSRMSREAHVRFCEGPQVKFLGSTHPYIPMAHGFMYLTAIIDIYSRFVVGWDVFNSLEAENSLEVLKRAIAEYGTPEIINSDQGGQFTCANWTEFVEGSGIKISMDGKGRAIDNIFIERLWRTVKHDYVYLHPAVNGSELYWGLKDFFQYYNTRKTHQGIGRVTPETLYRQAA
jgi:putative transposase